MPDFLLRDSFVTLSCSKAFTFVVGTSGFEPPTSRLSGARSNQLSYAPVLVIPGVTFPFCLPTRSAGGDDGIRTHDPLLAGQVLSQLSYTPVFE